MHSIFLEENVRILSYYILAHVAYATGGDQSNMNNSSVPLAH